MGRHIKCKVQRWDKQTQKHIFEYDYVYKYRFSQRSEMNRIYNELHIGELFYGQIRYTKSWQECGYEYYNNEEEKRYAEHIFLILGRSDIYKIDMQLKKLRHLKYEQYDPYFWMIEAIRNFLVKCRKQKEFILVDDRY